ncbi:MAG: CPBP family intramembrane glutamic endopeptidase [Balneolales bacterium]
MHIFDNPRESRIRAGWRLLIQALAFLFLLLFSYLLLSDYVSENIMLVWVSVVATLSVWFAARILDFRRLKEYGLDFNEIWLRQFLVGFGLGAGAMAAIFLIYLVMGWVEFLGFGWQRFQNGSFTLSFLSYFFAMCSVGYYEELWSRGYQTRNLAEGLNFQRFKPEQAVLGAILLTAAFFGMLHAWNPHATVLSTVVITLAGIMFAVPYVITGQLGISIGLHISWNFFQGGVFGFPVSGLSNPSSILQVRTTGPEIWTGGLFGPEAGFLGLIFVILIIVVVLVYLRRIGYPLKPITGFAEWNGVRSSKRKMDN